MTDIQCSYVGDREATLIAYLYDDIDPGERAVFDVHLASCARCRGELSALGGVRRQLVAWTPPDYRAAASPELSAPGPSDSQPWWRTVPAWAQVAAALLFLGVSAGVANLDIHSDANGLAISTGWMTRAARPAGTASTGVPAAATPGSIGISTDAASRADLVALEERLRGELRAVPAATPAATGARIGSADAELLRKVRALVEESEKRQQRELALRLAQVMTDVAAQRQADLRKIDTTLTGVQRDLGIQVLQQRERMNYLMRVNQRQ